MTDEAHRTVKRAGLLATIGLLYASACGGPYGTEDFVARVGPGLVLTLLVAAAGLWGVPLALATAELSARRPIEGGYYRWVLEHLGGFWGYQAGIWSLFSSILDNALYPVLFASALSSWIPGMGPVAHWIAAVGFIALLTWLNVRGIAIVGIAAVALNIFLFLPLIWIVAAGFARWQFNPFVPWSADGTTFGGLGAGLALAIWFHSGYADVSTAGEEIADARRTIPKVLLIVTPLVVLSYVVPMVAGLAAVGGWRDWQSGQFVAIGEALGGPLLGVWTLLGSVASFVVIFMSYVLWWSRLAWAFAADGFLPAWLVVRHPRHGTPHRVLILYGALYSLLALVPFTELLILDVWLFGAYNLLLTLSVVRARRKDRTAPEGFRIPGGRHGPLVNASILGGTWLLVLAATAIEEPVTAAAGALLLTAGVVIWLAAGRPRPRPVSDSQAS